MCKIGKKINISKAVGYKAVIKMDGKYYSPSTGLEYVIGMTLPSLKRRLPTADKEWSNPLDEDYCFYEPLMQGKTGIFKTLEDCIQTFRDNKPYHILQMTLGGDMYEGRFNGCDIFIGSVIIDIFDGGVVTRRLYDNDRYNITSL